MGYPYLNFCLCGFWGALKASNYTDCRKQPSAELDKPETKPSLKPQAQTQARNCATGHQREVRRGCVGASPPLL